MAGPRDGDHHGSGRHGGTGGTRASRGHGGNGGPERGDGHGRAPSAHGRVLAFGIALNLAYVVLEAGFGFATNSLGPIADAWHHLSDVPAREIGAPNPFLADVCGRLREAFGIHLATLQLEAGMPENPCGLVSEERV